jgi:hypothetical protein
MNRAIGRVNQEAECLGSADVKSDDHVATVTGRRSREEA